MHVSLADRTLALNAREFAEFTFGPMGGRGGMIDPERAQLGMAWHDEMRQRLAGQDPAARFEVPIDSTLEWRGWRVRLTGRIDQIVPRGGTWLVREVKTVLQPLPAPEPDLRAGHAPYFRQLAVYQCLHGADGEPSPLAAGEALAGELVFVEPGSGIVQIVAQTADDARRLLHERLDELWAFAEQRRTGLERLRSLRFAPAFVEPRPGQETILEDLRAAAQRSPVVLFEAPTGFGKTGCVLEFALGALAAGHFTRVIYLTGKSTGQLQVVRQLDAMVGRPPGATWWQIRNKSEHCVNEVYHCFRDACRFLDGQEVRWPVSGLQRFGQDASLPRDLETLRAAGREARVCPYEITRAALPFTDVWIGDYNYVFAPSNRSFLENMPGFDPTQTLLVVDEAHNLATRVADACSSEFTHAAARATLGALDATGAPPALLAAWERFALFLARVEPAATLDPLLEAELADHLAGVARQLEIVPLDHAALGPAACDMLFAVAGSASGGLAAAQTQPALLWSPARGAIRSTCLDASATIAETLGAFGQAVFLSATLSPIDHFARQCGVDRLQVEPAHLVARTPWRDRAYDVAIDARVDTRYERRSRFFGETAATIAALHGAGSGPVVAFFPSYAYAEKVQSHLEAEQPQVRTAIQPRTRELAAQTAFLEESLAFSDVLLLVLGSSFSESIDLLGGRVAGAVVVGPALPEVNGVQRAKMDASRAANRTAAFREVYQIPGVQKVNQALGRLVRAPGQRARVLLHCRRFAEPSYHDLLAPEYRDAPVLASDADLRAWLGGSPRPRG